MRLLYLGDIVGKCGRAAVLHQLPHLRDKHDIDFAIVNGDNAAGGFGINEDILQKLLDAGADVVTGGDHIWDQRETLVYIERYPNLLKPLNFSPQSPGNGFGLFKAKNDMNVLVIHGAGRVFMKEADCPFHAIDKVIEAHGFDKMADAIVVDFHAEATSEKQAMGHFLDGKVSLVVGSHTHVPTNDARILEGGTAYQTDAGMCGVYDSVIGMEKSEPIHRFLHGYSKDRFRPAEGKATLSGLIVEVDDKTGLAEKIEIFSQDIVS